MFLVAALLVLLIAVTAVSVTSRKMGGEIRVCVYSVQYTGLMVLGKSPYYTVQNLISYHTENRRLRYEFRY